MKKLFSLLFIFFSYYVTFAQNAKQIEFIDKKLKEIAKHINDDPKSQENQLLQLKAESEKINYDLGILQSGNLLMKLYGLQAEIKKLLIWEKG